MIFRDLNHFPKTCELKKMFVWNISKSDLYLGWGCLWAELFVSWLHPLAVKERSRVNARLNEVVSSDNALYFCQNTWHILNISIFLTQPLQAISGPHGWGKLHWYITWWFKVMDRGSGQHCKIMGSQRG